VHLSLGMLREKTSSCPQVQKVATVAIHSKRLHETRMPKHCEASGGKDTFILRGCRVCTFSGGNRD
jgi:hypothetical protein